MRRRDALKTLGIGALATTAGCLGGFQRQSAWRDPPLVDDRPDAVYLPAITEGMALYGKRTVGPYGVALTYSYPHRFWSVAGTELQKTVVDADDSLHLMASLWDDETGTVLPLDAGVSIEITRDGSLVSEEVAYPMLSQQMGMHYGSNYKLDGQGDYTAHVRVGGTTLNRTGSFAGRFDSVETATFEFTFDTNDLYDVKLTRLGDRAGQRGAIPAMEMGVPTGHAKPVDSLPGRHLGRAKSGDGVFDAFAVDDGGRFGSDGAYLYVSARTPHNGFVLPMMGVRATLTRGGDAVVDDVRLVRTLDPDVGYHYGLPVESVESGDALRLSVDIPPQVARHDGYETAFLRFDPMTFDV